MKKLILFSIVAVMAFAFSACSSSNDNEKISQPGGVTADNNTTNGSENRKLDSLSFDEQLRQGNEFIAKSKEIPVGQENFQKLVSFIKKHGKVVPQNNVPSDYQFTFYDSHGNRHAMITIQRDAAGNPTVKGQVSQISVWAFYKGIRDQKHYFGYLITPEKVGPFDFDGGWKEADDVRFGYDEFLAKVSK